MDLDNRIALVTGSSRGIGTAIAKTFAANGATVILHGRDKDALTSVRGEIEASGGRAVYQTADLTSIDDIDAMRARIETEFGTPDILVVNAGGSFARPALVEEIDPDEWRASIEGNLTATFLTVQAFLPGMTARGSENIITLSSAAARKPYPVAPVPYAAAKAGVQIFTQDLAAQVGPFGMVSNCIAPETILSGRNKERIPADKQEAFRRQHPLQRLGRPEGIGEAALYLASSRSSWVTGIVLDVGGGAVMV
ncbi:MAG: SDR family NAD(P)-dependent oxidoreductase [Pseudorhizobium sp.]